MIRKLVSILLVLLLVFCVSTSALAAETGYVLDEANLLTPEQWQTLEQAAEKITEQYEVGVYIITVDNYTNYSHKEDPFDATWDIYHANELGYGKDREGLVILISVETRDCSLFVYGENAEYAFNAYGQEQLENEYLDNFREDDWYGGCMDYLTTAGKYLSKAEAGRPVRDNPMGLAMLLAAIGWLIALAVTAIMYSSMKNVRKGTHADFYTGSSGVQLTRQNDAFTNRSYSYRRIETDSSSGSGSGARSGGGGSGRSSKF